MRQKPGEISEFRKNLILFVPKYYLPFSVINCSEDNKMARLISRAIFIYLYN